MFTSVLRPQGGVGVIAEPANTHNGSVEYLLELTRHAATAGADSIKYQVFQPDHLAVPDFEWYHVYEKIAIAYDRWREIFAGARAVGLAVMAEVFDPAAARFCLEEGVRAFKLNTADIASRALVELLAAEADVVFLSVGGSFVAEIHQVLDRLGNGSADVVINYGFQNYPTQPAHSHLAKIQLLGLHFGRPVCFADHVSGDDPLAIELPCLAVAAGATSIEKHIIQVRDADRYDYYSSITPPQFSDMVARIRQIETCVGPQTLDLDQPEREYREKHKKCPVLRHACRAGHQLSEDDVDFKRANGQKDFTSMSEVVGRTLAVDLEGYTALRQEHLR